MIFIWFGFSLLQLVVWVQGFSLRSGTQERGVSEFYPKSKRFGTRQSPVNLLEGDDEMPKKFHDLLFHDYSVIPKRTHLTNRGHTLELRAEWPERRIPSLSGGPLPGRYDFDSLHFHWGPDNNCGSEHLLDETAFPMEMHVVHKMSGLEPNEINSTPNSLLVVSYFIIVEFFSFFRPITDHIDAVLMPNSSIEIHPFALKKIIPRFELYFTYAGSLTTPPYSENVVWIISKIKLIITAEEIEKFRSLLSHEHEPILGNYRDTQNLFDRTIYFILHDRALY